MEIKLDNVILLRTQPQSLNATIAPGTIAAIYGENGHGKTTLLRALAGLGQVMTGAIRWNTGDRAPRPLSYMAQKYERMLFLWLSPRRNIERVAEREERDLTEQIEQELGASATNPAGILSGGEQQLVALASSIAAPGSLLLLDEPFSSLSAAWTDLAAELLLRYRRDRTIVIAAHSSTRLPPKLTEAIEGEIKLP